MGWNEEKVESLKNLLDDVARYKYEIDNCVRGCHTNCHTYKELAELMYKVSDRFSDCADDLFCMREDEIGIDE